MSELRELDLRLCDWETRAVLAAIWRETQRLRLLNETAEDEDVQADAGNDYLALAGLYQQLKEQATRVFGNQIADVEHGWLQD